ncbi:hypothetical protein COH20_002617 [Aspergillus flavus]|uniref:Uncharacterized protein n=2 Tax=Aspergillus subgen. Circumdati TaxID=2720871 RepID=A0AB74BSI9_ASPFL|nr:hypothetical protein COH20_002617 [Aspergillus flavus]RAQ72083.1 hypothetical protein COH21_012006 [Aspergillus flavus]RMZ37356.1 hypothetical protein CA14_011603 [Aspergillus flavus]
MAWFPADPNWNDFYLPPGIQQELRDLETIFRDMPPVVNQNHAQPSDSLFHAPKVDATPPDPHNLFAPLTNHNQDFDNQPMMSLSPFSNTNQPQGMVPVPYAEQLSEPSVSPKVTPKSRKLRPQLKSVQLRGNSTSPLRCG